MQDFILAKREEIAELCRKHHVRRLSVFGSAARDDFDATKSDVDLVVEFFPTATENFFSLEEHIARLFHRNVDLLTSGSIKIPISCDVSIRISKNSMQRDIELYLWDISQAIAHIQEFVAPLSLQEYLANRLVKAAVERNFEIIGEAIKQADKYFPGRLSSLPNRSLTASETGSLTATSRSIMTSYGALSQKIFLS